MKTSTFRNLTFAVLVVAVIFGSHSTLKANTNLYEWELWQEIFYCPYDDQGPSGWFGVICDSNCDIDTYPSWYQYFDNLTQAACEDYCARHWGVDWYCEYDSHSIFYWNEEQCATNCGCLCYY